ncbi:hypothetical protein RHMOL_Rhmol13G0081000 [Rhododendron molle]|uniref:Uncharacterized protein n=2 Tax=Rhododendron molle TaxID=49168 RepID=A0ACC0L484_RHOML|nr:hypothetical protein RHMOL_Rhmol13G0081000 [Rhododendron molle]KAI8523526.1 hypothetical protein RHMOL_Rhmol13G0081000 [Rhododendron molle]
MGSRLPLAQLASPDSPLWETRIGALLSAIVNDEKETKHLESLEGAESRLRLFQIDLLDYDSLVAAVNGATGVFHLASPCIVDEVKDPENELLAPAIKGTNNVLTAAKELGVRRVVVTSSISAITPSPYWPADKVKNEDCWTDVDYCKQNGLWYPLSKTLAEKAAWEFAKEKGLDVVVVNPGTVMGPVLPPTLNASMLMLLRLLQGCTETYENFFMGSIHVKDVALAHILVYENTSATGRHMCVEAISHYGDFAAMVAELYPEYNIPSGGLVVSHLLPKYRFPISMGSSRRRVSSPVVSLLFSHHPLLLLLLLITATCPTVAALSSSNFPSVSAGASEDKGKVALDLYYETLCPYCSNFIVNYLDKLFDSGLISAVDLNLIPYGNAKIGSNATITCQHGPVECLLNTIEACAISVWPDLIKHFSFIYCVETLVYEHKYAEWETCYDKLGLDATPVTECYTSGYGEELELQYAAETNTLQPPHEYVPWVVVDGQPLYDDYENFISYICEAYKGTTLPNACSALSLNTIQKKKRNTRAPVCYREDATKLFSSRIRSAITSWLDRS